MVVEVRHLVELAGRVVVPQRRLALLERVVAEARHHRWQEREDMPVRVVRLVLAVRQTLVVMLVGTERYVARPSLTLEVGLVALAAAVVVVRRQVVRVVAVVAVVVLAAAAAVAHLLVVRVLAAAVVVALS